MIVPKMAPINFVLSQKVMPSFHFITLVVAKIPLSIVIYWPVCKFSIFMEKYDRSSKLTLLHIPYGNSNVVSTNCEERYKIKSYHLVERVKSILFAITSLCSLLCVKSITFTATFTFLRWIFKWFTKLIKNIISLRKQPMEVFWEIGVLVGNTDWEIEVFWGVPSGWENDLFRTKHLKITANNYLISLVVNLICSGKNSILSELENRAVLKDVTKICSKVKIRGKGHIFLKTPLIGCFCLC